MATTTATKLNYMGLPQVSEYQTVSKNIYFDGYSYRVRASVGGKRYSRSFSSKRDAYAFRRQLLNEI